MKQIISPERYAYLKKEKRHKIVVLSLRFLILFIFLCLWEIAADKEWIDSFFFSSPSRVGRCFLTLLQKQSLITHLQITLLETIVSFAIVMILGLLIAALLWFSQTASSIFEPYLVILNSLPKSALAPLFIVWLGTGSKTIIVAGISVAIFGCIISIYTGFKDTDPTRLTLIKTLGGSKYTAFKKVVLPSTLPLIVSNMKINIGLSLVGVIIGEFLAARKGIGYLIIYGSQVFKLDMVITSILLLCLIAFLFYQAIQWLEKRIQSGFS